MQSQNLSVEEIQGIISGSRAVLENKSFNDTARIIFDQARKLTKAKAGYIGLLSEDRTKIDVVFLDSGGAKCGVDPSLPMPIRGLRAIACNTRRATYHNDFTHSPHVKFMPSGHVNLKNVLFAPLIIDNHVVGVMGLANKSTSFTSRDAEIATFFGEYAALALKNSRILDTQQETIKKLEETIKLREQVQELIINKNLIENVNDAIIGTDLQFIIHTWNKAAEKIYGWTRDEVLGKVLGDLVKPEYLDEQEKEVIQNFKISGKWKGEVYHKTKNGSKILIQGNISLIYDEEKNPSGAVSINRDITQSKMMEENLKKSEKLHAIGQLAGGIAHDFNNILSGIMGYTELSLFAVEKQSEMEKNLRQIFNGCIRARELINQIQDFSHKDQNKISFHLLFPITTEVLTFLRASIPNSVKFEQDLIPDTHPILVNPAKIHQILINIITNAVYSMDYNGTIRIHLFEKEIKNSETGYIGEIVPGSYSIIEISDNGKGMDDFTLSHIFEPFFSTKPKGKGSGLGLSVVYGIIQSYMGNIQIETEIDKGSLFRLFFPNSGKKIKQKEKKKEPISGSGHILLIDDEKSVLETYCKIIQSLGYTTTSCTNSITAMNIFFKDPDKFNLIISDKIMPEKDGIELARKILHYYPNMPIILCTGQNIGINSKELKKIGIRKLIKKPITRTELSQVIHEVLDA